MTENVTKQIHAIIIGSLLGDGHIQKTQSKTLKCRLRMAQGSDQKQYLYDKYLILSDLCLSEPKYDNSNKTYHFYTFYSLEMKMYHDLFYVKINHQAKYRKVIPAILKDILIDPLTLAVWYCDDGSKRADADACRLGYHGFRLEEIQILQRVLIENFQIPSHIVKSGKSPKKGNQWYVLSFSARDGGFQRFRELIYPIVRSQFPSMLYKLRLRSTQTP